MIDILLLYII